MLKKSTNIKKLSLMIALFLLIVIFTLQTSIGASSRRQKKNINELEKKHFLKVKSSDNFKGLVTGSKKRIKQKSLAKIVASNLKKVYDPQAVPKTSILKKSCKPANLLDTLSKAVTFPQKEKLIKKKKDAEVETLISFAKNLDNNVATVLKKKADRGSGEKSLSAVFSKKKVQDDEDNLLNSSPVSNVAVEKKKVK